MNDFRQLLAVLAALLAIVFITAWFIRGRQRSTSRGIGQLSYGVLLLISAFILWQKSDSRLGNSAAESAVTLQGSIAESAGQENRIDSLEHVTGYTNKLETRADSGQSEEKQDESSAWIRSKVLIPSTHSSFESLRSVPPKKIGTGEIMDRLSSEKKIEDVIESSIIDAFDFIENFFLRYGSSVESKAVSQKSSTSSSTIEFIAGSSELSQRSIRYLRGLVPTLARQFPNGCLEIQAQTNENIASSSDRLRLTKSRADAIKEVLMAEGFPADRIATVGSEGAGDARVKFVHRPR